MLSVSMGFSLSTWQTSIHANSSINFSYSGFDDPLLDYTAPVYFELKYLNRSAKPITNTTGACILNYSAPVSELISMNFSGNGTYWANLTFDNETLGNVFQISCNDSSNSSNNHVFSDGDGAVSFQYDLFTPVIIDVLNANETGPTPGTISSFIAGQPTTVYTLVRNITGDETPTNITTGDCTTSLNGFNQTASAQGFEDYFTSRFIPTAAGNLTVESTCLVNSTIYVSRPINLTTSPLLVPSGLPLGETSTFKQSVLLISNRSESYLTTSSNEGGALPAIQVRKITSAPTLLLNASYGTYLGSFAFLDINNTGDHSLIYAGSAITQRNVYSSIGTDFIYKQALPMFQNYDLPTLLASDLFANGFTDLLISGLQSGVRNTSLLINTGTDLTTSFSSIPDLRDASICYGDFDDDSYYDLFVSGQNSSGIETSIYLNNGSDFILNQTLPIRLYKSTCSMGRFLSENQTSLLHFGTNDTGDPDNPLNWNYVIYNDTRNWSQTTSGLLEGFNGSIYGDVVIADFSGDGLSDIFLCGGTSGNEILTLYVNDLNASSSFVSVDPFNESYALPECSLSAADYDFDGDLDLAYTGVGSGDAIQLFNNTASSNSPNSLPSPPIYLNGSWNESTGDLSINWSMGQDNETPQGMLSYNLEIESPTKGLLLSGQPSITSNPSQGYLGNMQYRLNTTLHGQTAENVVVRIQSIDAGLKRSAWTETSVLIAACEPISNWIVSTPSGCAIQSAIAENSIITVTNGSLLSAGSPLTLGTNVTIHIENGTFDLTGTTIDGNESLIIIGTNGQLIAINAVLYSVNLSAQSSVTIIDSQLDYFQSNTTATLINTTWNTINTTGMVDVRFYFSPTIRNQFNVSILNVSLFNGSAFFMNISRLNLTGYKLNATGNISQSHNLTFYKTGYYNFTSQIALTQNSAPSIILNKTPAPVTTGFNVSGLPSGLGFNYSGDLAAYSNVSNLTINHSEFGSITFLEPVNISFINLSQILNFTSLSINLNASAASGLNRTARLNFENLTFTTLPIVLRNDVICDSCSNLSYNGSALAVTVTGFSTYSLANNSQLSLQTPTVLFSDTLSNFSMVYATYGNASNTIENASCQLTIDTNTTVLNKTSSLHSASLYFNETKIVEALVFCSGNSSYEPLNQTFALNIVRNGAYFLKESEYTGLVFSSGFFGNISGANRFWTTGAIDISESSLLEISNPENFSLGSSYTHGHSTLTDLNNDGWSDLVTLGKSSSGEIFEWYDNLSDKNSFGLSLTSGDFEIFDYDSDGDLDILACGKNASSQEQTVILINQLLEQDYQYGTQFVSSSLSLPQLSDCTIEVVRDQNVTIILLAGLNASDVSVAAAYAINEGQFVFLQEFDSWLIPTLTALFYDFTLDGNVDLILSGTFNGSFNTSFYSGNKSGFTHNSSLSNQLVDYSRFDTRIAIGRLTNETNSTLLITGITDNGTDIKSYGYNGSDFVEQPISLDITPTYQGSLTLGDIDADSDLDLWITGQSTDGPITHLYTSTLAEYAGADAIPVAPTLLAANYSNATLHLNWSAGSDAETPNALLSYSLRIGNQSNPNHFLSGVQSSYASGQRSGNQGSSRSAALSLPDSCFSFQVQSIDSAYQSGNWSSISIVNNHSEICNGYDNDCDGLTDEDFFYSGMDLFTYNGSLNGTPFTCTFYETYAPERISCPNAPSSSQGDACNTATYTGATYTWNTTTKTCDCDLSAATLKNVQINSDRSTGGSGYYQSNTPEAEQEAQVEPDDTPAPETPSATNTASSSSVLPNYFTTSVPGFELLTTVTYEEGWTVVNHQIRNIERTPKSDIRILLDLNEIDATALKQLRSLNRGKLSEQNILTTSLGKLDYLEETTLLYSVPGRYDISLFKDLSIQIESKNVIESAALAKLESTQRESARESIIVNVTETVKDNKTVIRLDVNLLDNISRVNGIEIEQEIPKCLIEEITDSILESAIDPALLKHVEIKEADPLLVWRFDRLEDAIDLELTLDTLRHADCEDEVSLELLAKSFIYQNQPINKQSVFFVLLISLGLMGLIFSPVWLASRHRFHRHDNPHVVRLAKIILHQQHKGQSDKTIHKHLIHNDENETDIHAAFKHLTEHNPSRHGLLLYEHRVEIALFVSVLVLSIMELGGFLPGYLDWFKKVLSWAIMLMVVHHANLARLFFNEKAPRFSVALMTGFFLMHLVRLAEFASNGLEASVGFVFDWYVLLVRLDAQIHLSWILFTIGLLMVTGCAIYAARSLPIRERSLCSVFFRRSQVNTRLSLFGRTISLLVVFCVFFFSVFNRMIEWLAIAVDSALFVLAAIILMALSLSMIAHHHGHRSRHHWEKLGELLADGYLIWLAIALGIFALMRPFIPVHIANLAIGGLVVALVLTLLFVILRLRKLHEMSELEKIPLALDHLYEKFIRLLRYPRTIVLALSGLLVLQLVVESALYIIPNITGQVSHLYGSHGGHTLLALFGGTGLIAQQLFVMPTQDALLHALVYMISFLGLIALLLVPVWVWALAFRNRGHGVASGSLVTWMYGHTNWTNRLGRVLIIAGLPAGIFYLLHPIMRIEPLFGEGSAGVQFIPQLLQVSMVDGILALGLCLLGMLILAGLMRFRKTSSWIPYLSIGMSFTVLSTIYFIPFIRSLVTETVSLFLGAGSEVFWVKGYAYLLGTLQAADLLLVYGLGGISIIFIGLPILAKRTLVGFMKHHHPFDRVFELAEDQHLLEYYDEAKVRFAGNLVHHLEHYMRQCDHHDIPHTKQMRLIREHGYPRTLIKKASELIQ